MSVAHQAPFLSVVTRTQGRRTTLLRQTLASLEQQTDPGFEVLVVRHRATTAGASAVDEVIDASPLRDRIRILDVERSGRSSPLNDGFDAAAGQYVAILDDDDLALPNWVATFRSLADESPGQVLRTVAVRQPVRAETGPGGPEAVPAGEPDHLWPAEFHFVDHLLVNHTPPVALAFPRVVFAELGERFDEDLDTCEDWDFLMRAANAVGVASAPTDTCVYRWWVDAEGSRSLHAEQEWRRNEDVVRRRLDAMSLRLPPGSVSRLRALTDHDEALRQLTAERDEQLANAERFLGEAKEYLDRAEEAEATVERLRAKVRRLRQQRDD